MSWFRNLFSGQSGGPGLNLNQLEKNEDDEIAERLIAAGKWEEAAKMGQPAINRLVERLYYEDDFVQVEAALRLGEMCDPRAVEPLIAKLTRSGAQWRLACVDALVKIGELAVEPLIEALEGGNYPWAARALGEIGDLRAVQPLLAIFAGEKSARPSIELRNEALQALNRFKKVSEVATFLDGLKTAEAQPTKCSICERELSFKRKIRAGAYFGDELLEEIDSTPYQCRNCATLICMNCAKSARCKNCRGNIFDIATALLH